MSGTVPPPPPGHDGAPPSVPPASPATGVRRVASAYRRPSSVDPAGAPGVPLQHLTAPAAPVAPAPAPVSPAAGAPTVQATVHAPVPPPPEPAVHQPTQQLPPAQHAASPAYQAPQAYAPGAAAQPASTPGGYPAATQVQQPVPAYAAAPPPSGPGYAAAAPPPPPPPGRPKRRRLSAGWIAFIAIDAVLVVMVLAFAIQIFTSSAPGTAGTDAGTEPVADPTPSVSESAPESGPGEQVARFAAPSTNITCTIYTESATCGIAELNQQPAPVEGCEGTTGYVVTVDADGEVAQPCVAADEQPTAAGGDVDVLEYGDSITEGDFTCRSEDTGMSCTHDPSGQGFSLARAGIGTS